MVTAPSPRPRRSSADVRRLLLSAAEQAFADDGFSGTSTREIARRAGVSETLVFRHFGSKAGLFDVAVIAPFQEFLNSWVIEAETHPPGSTSIRDLVSGYIGGLYDLLHHRREIVLALISAHSYEHDLGRSIAEIFSEPFERIEARMIAELDVHHYVKPDAMVITRAVIAMVMGLSVMDEWMFPLGQRKPGRDRVVREVSDLVVRGLTVSPD